MSKNIVAGLRDLLKRERASEFANTLKISPYGVGLDPWQRNVLDSQKSYHILNCARQVGKSTVTAIKALHRSAYTPDSLVLLVSPSLRQSQEIFKKVAYYARQVADLPDKIEDNQLSLMFSNGSRIVALPGSQKTIRGYSAASLVIVDEAAFAEPSLFSALVPMLSISNGDLVLLSTPNGKIGFFWDVWDKGGQEWEKHEVPWWSCPRHDKSRLMALKNVIGQYRFGVEFECQFYDPEDAVFSYEDFEAAMGFDVDGIAVDISDSAFIHSDLEVLRL